MSADTTSQKCFGRSNPDRTMSPVRLPASALKALCGCVYTAINHVTNHFLHKRLMSEQRGQMLVLQRRQRRKMKEEKVV